MKTITVQDCLNRQPVVIPEASTLATMKELLAQSSQPAFPVVDACGRLIGMLAAVVVRAAIEEWDRLADIVIAADLDIAEPNPIATDDTLLTALRWLSWREVTVLPVVQRRDRTRLAGIVTEHDLLVTYARALRPEVRSARIA